MSAHNLKARLAQLEGRAAPLCALPAIRIVQDGELTAEQRQILADAEVTGRLVVVRQIVSPGAVAA